MKRKILMMCSVWYEDYIGCLLKGIQKKIESEDVEVHVFAVYDSLVGSEFLIKEQEIFSLPNWQDYDGVLIAVNSVGNVPVVEKIIEQYKDSGKQILSIDQKYDGASFLGIDNYQIFYEMIEHMVTVHDCKVLNYLGGPENHEENKERYRAFCDCLKKHNLPIEKERVLHRNFINSDGVEAYETWKERNMHLPDAVICANDYMALGYLSATETDGYQAPEDFRITGFDNFEEGQFFSPSLTSVNRNWEQLGYEGIEILLQLINGDVAPGEFKAGGKLALNESCGCAFDKRDVREDLRNVYRDKRYEERLEVRQRMNRQVLCSSRSVDDMQKKLDESFGLLGNINVVFCLKDFLFHEGVVTESVGYDEVMTAVGRNEQKKIRIGETLSLEEILQDHNCKLGIFNALHFGNVTYGFAIAAYENRFLQSNFYRTFMETSGLALENIRQREELRTVNERLQDLYVRDSLTGLYNRFGYVTLGEEYFKKKEGNVYLVYIDVDNLKLINDNYDHAMGDKAIIGVADAIKEVFADDAIRVRMGGDEFLVIGEAMSEEELSVKEDEVRIYLEAYTEKENLPFVLRASVGHVCDEGKEESLEALVKQADAKMYEVKQKRKTKSKRH